MLKWYADHSNWYGGNQTTAVDPKLYAATIDGPLLSRVRVFDVPTVVIWGLGRCEYLIVFGTERL